jgi:hypothetical protein
MNDSLNLHKVFLKEARLTKKGSAYFFVSTAQTNKVKTIVRNGIEYNSIVSDTTPRHWGYISVVDKAGKPLPLNSVQVQELFSRCTPTQAIDPRTGSSVTKYVGDNKLVQGYRLNTSSPMLRREDSTPTGGYWVEVHAEPATVTDKSTVADLKAYATANNVAFASNISKANLVALLKAQGLL